MNKLLVASAAAAFATVGAANAADLPMKAPPMVAAAPAMTWTGCYIAGGIGYGMWNVDHDVTNPAVLGAASTVTTTDGGRGWLGRGGIGCDYQVSPSFVIGAFGDWDWMSLRGSNTANEVVNLGGFQPVTANMKETGAGYVGLRLGYLITPSVLGFVDGGWTRTRFTQSAEFTTATGVPIGFTYPDFTVNGWFLGGGYEYAVPFSGFHGLFWKTEYRFAQYRTADLIEVSTATGVPSGNTEHSQAFVQTITSSLVWRFNFGGPVVARY
jgi:outer membrane immunogenic protein